MENKHLKRFWTSFFVWGNLTHAETESHWDGCTEGDGEQRAEEESPPSPGAGEDGGQLGHSHSTLGKAAKPPTTGPSSPTLKRNLKQNPHMIVYSGFIYRYQKLETTQMSSNPWMVMEVRRTGYVSAMKRDDRHTSRRERTSNACRSGEKPDSEGHVLYDVVYMNILEPGNTTGPENRWVIAGAGGEEKGLATEGPKEPSRAGGHVANLDVGGHMTLRLVKTHETAQFKQYVHHLAPYTWL